MCLTTMLAAGPALLAPDVANANGLRHYVSGHSANNARRSGIRPRFVIRGQATNTHLRTDPHGQFDTNAARSRLQGRLGQTTTHGNATQPTTASNANPTAHVKPIFNNRPPATAPSFVRKTVDAVDRGAKTAVLLPPIAGVAALPVATGVVPLGGAFFDNYGRFKLDPIQGPRAATVDYIEKTNSQVWGWISSIW
jgi:hypothetical protein